MEEKNEKKNFFSEKSAYEFGRNKLSLLRREYLSSAVNVLITSIKSLLITKTDFSQLRCLHSNQ